MISKVLRFAVLAAVSLLALSPAAASADGTGSISVSLQGGVSDVGNCGLRITAYGPDGPVSAFDPESGFVEYNGDSSDFKIEDLEPGDYRLQIDQGCVGVVIVPWDDVQITEFVRDQESLSAATPISVAAGLERTVQVDLSGPDPAIIPPDTMIDSGPSGIITANEATFGFSSSDPANTEGFECRLDTDEFTECGSAATFSSLATGEHTVSVRARHAVAGFADPTPATRTFTVEAPQARIGKLTALGPAAVKEGRKAVYRVRVTNSGDAVATGLKLRVTGRGVRFSRSIGDIPADTTRTARVKLKPKKPGHPKLTFRVNSSNGGTKSIKRRITVRK